MRAIGTVDTSCVIALDRLDLLPQVTFLFSKLLVPRGVRKDLFRRRATKDRLQRLFERYHFLQRCDDYDQGAVDLLLIERSRSRTQDRGEAEAVVQASQRGAMVLVDDLWGRKLAGTYALEFHGTIWILQRLHALGLISAERARTDLQRLFDTGFHLPLLETNAFLGEIGQAPLDAT